MYIYRYIYIYRNRMCVFLGNKNKHPTLLLHVGEKKKTSLKNTSNRKTSPADPTSLVLTLLPPWSG